MTAPCVDTFKADQERVKARINHLEREADAFTHAGREVLAGVSRRTARLLRWLWGVEEQSIQP